MISIATRAKLTQLATSYCGRMDEGATGNFGKRQTGQVGNSSGGKADPEFRLAIVLNSPREQSASDMEEGHKKRQLTQDCHRKVPSLSKEAKGEKSAEGRPKGGARSVGTCDAGVSEEE